MCAESCFVHCLCAFLISFSVDVTDEVNTALRNACLKKEVHR